MKDRHISQYFVSQDVSEFFPFKSISVTGNIIFRLLDSNRLIGEIYQL